jgi:hypothetical protein
MIITPRIQSWANLKTVLTNSSVLAAISIAYGPAQAEMVNLIFGVWLEDVCAKIAALRQPRQ